MAFTLYVINSNKLRKDITTKQFADDDITRAQASIASILFSPANCNANFYTKALPSGSLSGIKVCPQGSKCLPGGTPADGDYLIPASATAPSPWNETTTGISSKVRLVSLNYVQTRIQGNGIGPTNVEHTTPAIVKLSVILEKQLGTRNGSILTVRHEKLLEIPVVSNTSVAPTQIIGCPKSADSQIPYGAIAVNGNWSAWGACNGLVKNRSCTNPTPMYGGTDCVGSSMISCP